MTRPHVLLYLFLSLCYVSCKTTATSTATPERPPNIVLIITDDQGWGDLGFHGNPDIETPHLDRFAQQSTRFTAFYVSPVCAPTRSSLMTGRYSLRTGVYDTYNGGAMMATEEVTLAEYLQQNGYRTGQFGKWHLGDNYPSRPQDQGFDYSLMHRSGGMAQVGDVTTYFQFDRAYFDPVLIENGQPVQRKGYCSDIFTSSAIDFIEENQQSPFFAYLAYNAPHTPLQLPEEYDARYRELEFTASNYPTYERPFPEMSAKHQEDARKVYGMVTNIDDNVGRVLQKLDDLQLTENTLVIFMTDNGPQQIRYTGPYRGRKGSVYEGGIRVPFFLRYPAQFSADREIATPVAHIDVLPTLLELCGLPTAPSIDGKSLLPLLRNEQVGWADRPLFSYWQRGIEEPYWNVAVRQGNYKLVGQTDYRADLAEFELFNLADDPGEMHNLVATQPEQAQTLKNTFDTWYAEIIQSPHLGQVSIILGHKAENPSILNRNDAKGNWGVWAQDDIYAYWDVDVVDPGPYDVTLHLQEEPLQPGKAIFRLGNTQRTVEVKEPTQTVAFPNLVLPVGEGRLEAVYWEQGGERRKVFPFYVTVEKVGD